MYRPACLFVLTLLAALAPAAAQDMPGMAMPAANCSAPVAPPPALSSWAAKTDMTSATQASGLDAAMLTPGRAASVTLHPTPEVHYVAQPEKPGGPVTLGGMVAIAIAEAGTYQISLGSGAWLDVLKDGASVASSAHAPGPPCSGIRKMVQFPLTPGRSVIQISGNVDPAIQVLVTRVP